MRYLRGTTNKSHNADNYLRLRRRTDILMGQNSFPTNALFKQVICQTIYQHKLASCPLIRSNRCIKSKQKNISHVAFAAVVPPPWETGKPVKMGIKLLFTSSKKKKKSNNNHMYCPRGTGMSFSFPSPTQKTKLRS